MASRARRAEDETRREKESGADTAGHDLTRFGESMRQGLARLDMARPGASVRDELTERRRDKGCRRAEIRSDAEGLVGTARYDRGGLGLSVWGDTSCR